MAHMAFKQSKTARGKVKTSQPGARPKLIARGSGTDRLVNVQGTQVSPAVN